MIQEQFPIQTHDAFISYRHETGFYMAQIIYTHLIANGYSVFMDKTMDSGRYEEKIKLAIKKCKNFIVVLFPDDYESCTKEDSWLNREASTALDYNVPNIVPVMCDGFPKDKKDDEFSDFAEPMRKIMKHNGLRIHKDYSLDRDLDSLCDKFLKNTNSNKPKVSTADFFRYNLEQRHDYTVTGVDVAFHAGAPWLMPGVQNSLLVESLERKEHWRVLINTVDAAESIGKHMRSKTVRHVPFATVREWWSEMAEQFPDVLEVRECDIPLLHAHHSVKFTNNEDGTPYGDLHIKYYAYDNTRLDNAFEHAVSSYSKHYQIYYDEFEFLWKQSSPLGSKPKVTE